MIEDSQVEDALSRLKKEKEEAMKEGKVYSLTKYIRIIDMYHKEKVDVSKDTEFQRVYNGFFLTAPTRKAFRDAYYECMKNRKKDRKLLIETVLEDLYDENVKRVEASYASKMLSVINPQRPVLDSFVINNLNAYENVGIEPIKPHDPVEKRIANRVAAYKKICNWYKNHFKSGEAAKWIELFDKSFPEFKNKISEVKKIDLILWKIRK